MQSRNGKAQGSKAQAKNGSALVSGNQHARIEVIPDGDEHSRWAEIQEFLKALGFELDPWQERVLWASLLRRGDGWAARRVGVCAPRQNGKNVILEARELVGTNLLGEELVLHSAHLADTSMEHFRNLDNLLDTNEWPGRKVKHIRRQNGHEQIDFAGGHRIRFRTRTKGGGRGFGGSPLVLDEAMYLPEISYAAMRPIISAQPEPQEWMTGSAVDQQTMDDGRVFTKLRESALAGEDRIAWFEWSLDYPSPDDVPYEVMQSEEAQAQTNPAYGRRITRETILEELDAFPSPRMAAVERFGVGDWPLTGKLQTVIDLDLWQELADLHSQPEGAVVYGFDVRPDRTRAVIAAVGQRADGSFHAEVGEQQAGTGWLAPRLEQLHGKPLCAGIVCDGVGPAASLVPELLRRNVPVQVLTTPELGAACGVFFDAVQERRLRHLGQDELLYAIKGATQRSLGDRWAWSRRNSTSDISPLVAVTLALWGYSTMQPAAEPWVAFA